MSSRRAGRLEAVSHQSIVRDAEDLTLKGAIHRRRVCDTPHAERVVGVSASEWALHSRHVIEPGVATHVPVSPPRKRRDTAPRAGDDTSPSFAIARMFSTRHAPYTPSPIPRD